MTRTNGGFSGLPLRLSKTRRHMRQQFIAPSLLGMLPCVPLPVDPFATSPASPHLLSAHAMTAKDGKLVTMAVRETKRAPDFSIADVEDVCGERVVDLSCTRPLRSYAATRFEANCLGAPSPVLDDLSRERQG